MNKEGRNPQGALLAARTPMYLVAGGALAIILVRALWAGFHATFDTTSLLLFLIASIALIVPYAFPFLREVEAGGWKAKFGPLEELKTELTKVEQGGVEAVEARVSPEMSEEMSPSLEEVPASQATPAGPPAGTEAEEWHQYREGVKARSRNVFLAHALEPSAQPGQKYDVYIFLTRYEESNLVDVKFAEFFFGRYWGNKIFRVDNNGVKIGVYTAAYGPFLCVCRVTFKDDYQASLERLIDFEMGRVFAK